MISNEGFLAFISNRCEACRGREIARDQAARNVRAESSHVNPETQPRRPKTGRPRFGASSDISPWVDASRAGETTVLLLPVAAVVTPQHLFPARDGRGRRKVCCVASNAATVGAVGATRRPAQRKMHKIRRKYLILTGVMVALPLLALLEERLRGEWLLAACKRDLIARGEKLTIEELTPPRPPGTNVETLTPDQAAALIRIRIPTKRLREAPPLAEAAGPGRAIPVWQRQSWARIPGQRFTWDAYLKAAWDTLEGLPYLRRHLTNRILWVTIPYEQGFGVMLPHLGAFLGASRALCQAAALELHQGDPARAFENLHAAACLTDALQSERLTISQLVRLACATTVRDAVWEVLQAEGGSDAQLAGLQADWESQRFTPPMVASFRMERAFCSRAMTARNVREFEKVLGIWRTVGPGGESETGSTLQWAVQALRKFMSPVRIRLGLLYWKYVAAPHDERFLWLETQRLCELASQGERNQNLRVLCRLSEPEERFAPPPARSEVSPYHRWSSVMLAAQRQRLEAAVKADAWNQVMVTAIALKRFHLKHGRWPESLRELIPEFLSELPVDWMAGRPLRYRRREDGAYLLYSVGADGVDQGGDPTPVAGTVATWREARDLVWPRAATPEEIAVLEAREAAQAAGDNAQPPSPDHSMP